MLRNNYTNFNYCYLAFSHLIELISISDFGCSDTITKNIEVDFFKGLFVPNAFTPESGSSEVRVFQPKGKNLKEYRIQIFDTWGILIWESNLLNDGEPAESWNGYDMFKGVLCQQDVYVWKVDAMFLDGTIWKGKKYSNGQFMNTGTVTLIK